MNWRARLPVFAAALWWGSLTTTGFVVVPLLFAHLPTPALAGQTAARLFTAQNISSIQVTPAAQTSGAWFGNSSYQSDFANLWGVG